MRQIISQIETQTEKLNFLIASLVKTSRLENGIIAVAPKQNCVGELLRQLDHAYAAGAGHADGLTKTALTEACRALILYSGQPKQAEQKCFCKGTEQKPFGDLDVNCDCNGENCKINIAGVTCSSHYESALC